MAKKREKAELVERYELIEMTHDEMYEQKIMDAPGWEQICENRHGTCFWNKYTGELIWENGDENIVGYSKLKPGL